MYNVHMTEHTVPGIIITGIRYRAPHSILQTLQPSAKIRSHHTLC